MIKKYVTDRVCRLLGIETLKKQIELQEMEIAYLKDAVKRKNCEKIRIVFLCNRPQMWPALETIYEECKKDDMFETYLVAIPARERRPKVGFEHDIFESTGAEEFLKCKYDNVIEGYNYNTGKWVDLFSFHPDFVFYQTSYNIEYPKLYNNKVVSAYAKVCYVPYGAQILGDEILEIKYNFDFCNNLSYIFVDSDRMIPVIESIFNKYPRFSRIRIESVGFPKYDRILNATRTTINDIPKRKFKLLWTPRWCTEDGNCNFFDYKDELLDYAHKNSNEVELTFRPHPHMWPNLVHRKEMTQDDVASYLARYAQMQNTFVDSRGDYIDSFCESDVLITDGSSLIAEYFLTGKPIIYCHKKVDGFTEFGKALSEGFYWVKNWNELCHTLNDLKEHQDRLYDKRQKLIKQLYKFSGKSAGENIKNILKADKCRKEG